MDYNKTAIEILNAIGGASNINKAAHCATRLRLVINDNSKLQKEVLENIDGVKGIFIASGQLQIIIGTGEVNKVYAELLKEGNITEASKDDVKQAATNKQNWFLRLIKTLGDVFVPIIPAIVACGILMGLMDGLNNIEAFSSFTSSNFYKLLSVIANASFSCLPILIAISAAKVFGGNVYLAAAIGIIMVHPNLVNAWNSAALTDNEIIYQIWDFKVYLVGYQGHVIPVVIAIWLMSLIERKLHRVVPAMIDLFITPLVTVLATALATMLFIGPVFGAAENLVINCAKVFIELPFGIGGFIIGGLYAFTVVCGLHHMYNTIEQGLISTTGYNTWMPIASCVNTAQGAACLAVGVKTKDKKLKGVAFPAALSAYLGITEPAIFGVNLRYRIPLFTGCVGGAIGGWFVSLIGVKASGYGLTGIFGILITYFDIKNLLLYLCGILIASVVAFVLTYIFYKDKRVYSENEVVNPIKGEVISLSAVKDETFASKALGDGIAIVPTEEGFSGFIRKILPFTKKFIKGYAVVKSPINGKVETFFETHHAIGISNDTGLGILIHFGINTVELNGKGFTPLVKEGEGVSIGQKLFKVDLDFVKEKGFDITTPIIFTDMGSFTSFKCNDLNNKSKNDEVIVNLVR